MAADPSHKGKFLRIYIEKGGCSSYQYGFKFDEKKDSDTQCDFGEVKLIVDAESASMLKGSQIDYKEEFSGSGFSVTNPNAKDPCGCGQSFQIK